MSNANANKSNQNTVKVEVAHNVDAAQTETIQLQNTHGKLMELIKEITALNENEVLILGTWAIQEKENIVKRLTDAFNGNKPPAELYSAFFQGAPVVPDIKVMKANVEVKLIELLEKVAVLVDTFLGVKVGGEFRQVVATEVAQFQKAGNSTDWEDKKTYLKQRVAGLQGTVLEQFKPLKDLVAEPKPATCPVPPTTVPVETKKLVNFTW